MYNNIIIFILIYLVISNWFQVKTFLKLISGPKIKTSLMDDKWIKSVVKSKTGLKLLDVTIFHDDKLYGVMTGFPFYSKMILSEGILNKLNKDELEWVVLHEAGHCILWHNLQSILIEGSMIILGVFLITIYNLNLIFSLLTVVLLSIISVQTIRWLTEYTADRYSISRVENPMGVITAQSKLRQGYTDIFSNEKSIIRFLLHWNIYPEMRIRMAKERLNKMNI